MEILLSCQELSKAYGSRGLFQNLSLSIFSGDRIGLIGLNGCGKSTLLKILAGLEKVDHGIISPRRGLKIGYLPQDCLFSDVSPKQVLMSVLRHLPEYEQEQLAEEWLSRLGFLNFEGSASRLSGGWKKRLGIAKELILEPDILLLDEPTNHLDLDGVLWLEKFLKSQDITYLVVSHDRYFIQHVANRIIEIDRVYPSGMLAIDGSYENFLSKKEEFIQGQLNYERSLATKARRETEWLRAGVKARTTKSQSRIDEAHEILEAHSDVKSRNTQKSAEIGFSASERETRKLIVLKNIKKELGGKTLFQNLDFTLSPGTRLGLMGPNGSGKTTLFRLIAGEIEPEMGTIKRAEGLQIVTFDQHRTQLPMDISLRDALSPKGDYVDFGGQKIHVNGWCKRFLFSPDILEMPIGQLSGGERARIAIAHLMLQKADVLLLDEPTNDLDIPTLEALEESLMEFSGAVVLITHDRCMMTRVCNSILSLGDPNRTEVYSDYSQWEKASKELASPQKKAEPKKAIPRGTKDIDAIQKKIEKAEEALKALTHRLEEVSVNPIELEKVCKEISLAETQIEQLYLRWEELERKTSCATDTIKEL
ncbi:MAG TPA: ABC-F family ATP-binding cassette domain-containing protein [Chlamydiales bacterium]|nr:ABC-F family ATP-binding cassette domain-containing protein [Chlamydiales bacterium]